MEEMFECSFCNFISGIIGNYQKAIDILIQKENLTRNQSTVLFCIYKNKKITVNEICKELGLNQGNTSSICKILEEKGIIKKIRYADDERAKYMVLTKKGTEKIERINNRLESFSKYLEEFNNYRIESISQGLKNFDELLNKIIEGEK